MLRYALAAVAAAALFAPATRAAAPSPAPAARALPAPFFEARAWQVLLVDGLAVVLDADLRHVTGVDLATGRRRYRRAVLTPDESRGYHTLALVDGRLFLWAGPTLVELDPRTGRALRRGETVHNDAGRVLMADGPQGAISAETGLWLVSLAPRVATGAYFRATEVHMYEDLSEPHTTHWLHSARFLFGRAGARAVVAVEDHQSDRRGLVTAVAMLAAVDPRSGEVAWRTNELVADGLTAGGMTADAGAAWVLSESTRAAGAVAAATGELVWKVAPSAADTPFNGDLLPDGAALAVLVDDHVTCRELATGRERWRAPAAGADRVVALGGRGDTLAYAYDKPLQVALAAAAGRVVTVTLPPHSALTRDGAGVVLASPGRLRTYDAAGDVVSDVSGPGYPGMVTPAAAGGTDDGAAVLYGRDGARLATLPEGTDLMGGAGDVIVLRERSVKADQPGSFQLIRVATPKP
ncbi:MAG: PQQ-binding-like beta-propeller repeat protein [Deltaproteobacteria bacterium]|nr:PQQ-binding-like beta-propeller repeat protein [Deltaproteobacteria bacterium]